MISKEQTEIDRVLKEGLRTCVFSAYQLTANHNHKTKSWFGGKTSHWSDAQAITESTFFDLGSLTKVIATTSIIARLVDQKKLSLSQNLGDFFKGFKSTAYSSITVQQLLTHSSGLIAWHPFYLEPKIPLTDLFCKNEESFLDRSNLKKTVYSDLGFLLLGEILNAHFGPFEKLFEDEVLQPLNLRNIQYGPLKNLDCVATEFCLERKKLIQGEVFDLNTAHFGHRCSHAGLFSSAQDLLPWAVEWLSALEGQSRWLTQKTAKVFTQAGQGESGGTWALGWDTKSKAFSSAGDFFSNLSFGHLGYPGTSIWVDPASRGVVIFLTNRVHPSRFDERIKKFRPLIHNLISKFWEQHGN